MSSIRSATAEHLLQLGLLRLSRQFDLPHQSRLQRQSVQLNQLHQYFL
jgi:hypothetical protein